MSIEKDCSIILSAMPYRESSVLLSLFSRQRGRMSALAKGTRGARRGQLPLERGSIIEHVTYVKPHRELHLVTSCVIVDHFPSIRRNLDKTAARDLLLETALATMRAADPHPELFDYLHGFFAGLEEGDGNQRTTAVLLAETLFGFAGHLGVGIDLSRCSRCGTAALLPLAMDIAAGMLYCTRCNHTAGGSRTIPALQKNGTVFPNSHAMITDREAFAFLRLASDYCRYHLDITRQLASFAFIERLWGEASVR
jgi:DNA repair protein RecO (recombination protein O)